MVLYNGEAPWTAPRTLQELIQPLEGFSRPAFEYVVLDVGHYPVEDLRPVEDVVSGVFLMEQAADLSGLREVVEEVQAWLGRAGRAPRAQTKCGMIKLLASLADGSLKPRHQEITPMYKITLDIRKLPEGVYLGTSPELPGLVVQGDSAQEVLQLAPEVAHDLIAVMVETGQPLPRGIETVNAPSRIPLLVPA